MKKQKGFAALLIIFVLGMVSILVASGLILTGYNESQMARSGVSGTAAFYAANSGVEEAIYKLNYDSTFGEGSHKIDLQVGTGNASVSASVTGNYATIDSIGTSGNYVKKVHAVVQNTLVKPRFQYAVQAGSQDFELEQESKITGKNNTDGNVYSNRSIKGKSNGCNPQGNNCPVSCSDNSTSGIMGYATAVNAFEQLDNGSGVCVEKDASASASINPFSNCYIKGTAKSTVVSSPDSKSCPIGPPGSYEAVSLGPSSIDLPDMQLTTFKDTMPHYATTCADLGSCLRGNNHDQLGPIIVNGDLNISVPSGTTYYISGSIWVKGNLTIDTSGQNSSVSIDPAVTKSLIVLADGRINTSSNLTLGSSGNIFLLFMSTFIPNPVPSNLCDLSDQHKKIAIDISSNSNSALFYAQNGCLYVESNSTFHGSVVGEKVHVSNQSTVEYDPALLNAEFGPSEHSGWQITSFSQD